MPGPHALAAERTGLPCARCGWACRIEQDVLTITADGVQVTTYTLCADLYGHRFSHDDYPDRTNAEPGPAL